MAKQSEVIGPRAYESRSMQWYRKIGTGKFRFRVAWKPDGEVIMSAERASGFRKWEIIHVIRVKKEVRQCRTQT